MDEDLNLKAEEGCAGNGTTPSSLHKLRMLGFFPLPFPLLNGRQSGLTL